eukprot:3457327-Pyramimonas_sp.AAC.1
MDERGKRVLLMPCLQAGTSASRCGTLAGKTRSAGFGATITAARRALSSWWTAAMASVRAMPGRSF